LTTVVAAPNQLWSDSRETGAIKRNRPKHFKTVHGYLVGVAGDSSCLHAAEHLLVWPKRPTIKSLTKWLHSNYESDKIDFNETQMLVVTKTAVYCTEGLYVWIAQGPAVIGSGSPWAEGYLKANPDDLKGAVEAACYFDPWSAGPVQGPFTVG
jgi:hypothetical protein